MLSPFCFAVTAVHCYMYIDLIVSCFVCVFPLFRWSTGIGSLGWQQKLWFKGSFCREWFALPGKTFKIPRGLATWRKNSTWSSRFILLWSLSCKVQSVWKFEEPPKNPQWRKTIQVWYMSGKLQTFWKFEETPKNAQWRKTLQVWYMSGKLQRVWTFEEPPKNPQWRKTIQVWYMSGKL